MKYTWIMMLAALLTATAAQAQSYRSLVDDGNDAYAEKKYKDAETKYKESIREKPDRIEGHFNLGNTAYRKNDVQAALDAYKNAATKAKSKEQVAETLFNVGNAYMQAAEKSEGQQQQMQQQMQQQGGNDLRMQGYRQAIEAYKQGLKLNPKDADTRYNLVYAMKKLEELQQQNQNQNQNQDKDQKKDQKQDKKEDQKQDNKDKKQDEQKKEQQQQQQQNKDQKQQQQSKPEQQQQKQQEQKMSKEQAEQILKALEHDEKDLQKKVRAQKSVRVQVDKDW